MTTYTDPLFVRRLAEVLLHGTWARLALRARAWHGYPDDRQLLTQIVEKVWDQFDSVRPKLKILAAFLNETISAHPHEPDIRRVSLRRPKMTPRWPVPALATAGKLAAWLDLPIGRLDWLADVKGLTIKQTEPKLRHYVNVWIPRRRGKPRLLEVPKPQLKAIQRRILHAILDKIPPHDAAHGFRVGRSIVSYVQPHVGRRIVLRFDLRDFFASVSAARVQALFRTAGYPRGVARLLCGLCTTRTPEDVAPLEPRWRARHLPQGAPTSPALANLATYRLDVRLQALALALNAKYTRYADDLAFSGDQRLMRAARRVQILVAVVAAEEGFELNFRKSRFMREGVRQQLAGVVVNVRPNPRRAIYDELKATLHNCVRHGPATQNRAGCADFRRQLLGRVGYVKFLNPPRGAKLRALFDRIIWPDESPNNISSAS
jgi:hypothetical protein